MEEREIKLEIDESFTPLTDLITIVENKFNVKFGAEKKISDIYFDNNKNTFYNNNHSLRIRKNPTNTEITYKALFHIPDRKDHPWFVLEKELTFPFSLEDLNEIIKLAGIDPIKINIKKIEEKDILDLLKSLNLKESVKINKKRLFASNENYDFFIDSINGLGLFLEIEAKNDNNPYDIIKNMEIPSKEIRFGFTNLYAKRVLGLKIPEFDKLYKENPDWNYFPGQKELVLKILSKPTTQTLTKNKHSSRLL